MKTPRTPRQAQMLRIFEALGARLSPHDPEARLAAAVRWELRKLESPPGQVRTLRDFSEEEIMLIEKLYGARVLRPGEAPGAPPARPPAPLCVLCGHVEHRGVCEDEAQLMGGACGCPEFRRAPIRRAPARAARVALVKRRAAQLARVRRG